MGLPTARLFLTGIFVTFGGSFHFGYQLSIVNPTQEVFESFFNSSYFLHYGTFLTKDGLRVLWSTVTGILFIGCVVGACLMPYLAERFGRQKSLFVSSVLFILSCFPSALAYYLESFELFMIGRVCFGIASGLGTGFQSLYLTEISPRQYRGFMGALTGLMVESGLLVGSVVALPTALGSPTLWPAIFWIEIVPSAVLLVVLCVCYESPSYLLANNQDERAKKSIQIYHQCDSAKIKEFIETLQEELDIEQDSTSLFGLFKVRLARKGALLGVLVAICVSFSGVTAISFFSTYLMAQTGFTSLEGAYANVGIAAGACLSACIAPFATEKVGRRPLFLTASTVLAVLNCVLLVLILLFDYTNLLIFGYLFIAANVLFMLTFGIGIAPIFWFLTTELVPQNCKAAAQGLTIMVNYIGGFLAPIIFLPLEGKVGAYGFLIFIIPLVICIIYFYGNLPETKNMSTVDVLTKLYGNVDDALPSKSEKMEIE